MAYCHYNSSPHPHLSMSFQLPHPRQYMGGLAKYLPTGLVGEDYTISIGRCRPGFRLNNPGCSPKQGFPNIDYMIFLHGQRSGSCQRIYTCMTVDEYGGRVWEMRWDDVRCGFWGCGGWRVKTVKVGVLKAEYRAHFDELVETVKPGHGWKFMCAVIGYACHKDVGWFVESWNKKSRAKERSQRKAREKLGIFPTADAHFTRKNCGAAPGMKFTW